MPQWLRNLTMLVVLTGWIAIVTAYLVARQLPPLAVITVPGALILALSRQKPTRRRARPGRRPADTEKEHP